MITAAFGAWLQVAAAGAPSAPPEPTPPEATPPEAPRPEAPPPPEFMRNKRRMSDADLADKAEHGYFTGLPLINSDPDTGVGLGARILYFDNGDRSDSLFAYTPYRHRAYAQAFVTTNGYQYHTLDWDAPYLRGEPLRVRASVVFEKNIAANYFGTGERSLDKLRFPGSTESYRSYDDYRDALEQIRPDGTAFTRYDQYILERPQGVVTLEHDFFGGVVRGLAGVSVSHASVRQWTNETVSGAGDVDAVGAPTRLHGDCAAGRVVGCAGGWNNTLKVGFVYDTRDFEPDPNSGAMTELTAELSGRYTASEYDWARLTFAQRVFVSPFPKLTDLVLAGRVMASIQSADVPFFAMNQLSMSDGNRAGLGGLRTIRGFKQDRFVGRIATLLNLEVRWTFWEFDVPLAKKQHFALMLAPFVDVGRVFDSLADFDLRRFRNGQGAGLRIAWNQATVVVLDYGVSREGSTLYINFNHPF